MVALNLLFLALACYCVTGFPQDGQDSPNPKTTIFGDELLEGEIFDNLRDVVVFDDEIEQSLYRLPTTTKPNHYRVLLGVNFDVEPQAFNGEVQIELEATQAGVNQIIIHSDGLNITTLTLQQGTTTIPVSVVEEPVFHFLRIQLDSGTLVYNALTPVVYTLTVTFEAALREDMTGFYKSWFRNQHTDPVSWIATTHFQATAARRAFPCYDEPGFKATFDITLRRPSTYRSWSCTRQSDTINSPNLPGYQDDIFSTTPVMSTYLLAFIVAEYDSLPIFNENNQLVYEVIARPNALATNQGQYALEIGQDLLAEMSNHTNYDFYSINENLKMTQASISDFSAGAMENWGLLIYREAYIMYDPVHTNSYYKQLIAYILSHEIAHMWFGNLVTCDWWGMLWLNEGFARYYQYFLTDWVETDMGFENRFITEQVHTALLSDSANNPHPLTTPGLGDPVAIRTMFTVITYNKGAAIIRMTEHLLGHEVHREGLRNYLVENRFSTVMPINLFESLQAAGDAAGTLAEYGPDFSLIEYYLSWSDRAGHPVLEVQVNHQTGDMIIHQRRFNINTGYSNVNTNWIIPITFSSASDPNFENTKPTHIISKAVTVINRGSIGDEWVLFNKQQTGYYRVNYDDYTWDLITAALRGPARAQIHEYNRAQIVNDVFQFARSGLMSYTKALNILSFLEFETSYAPWVAAMTGFTWLRNRVTGSPLSTPLQTLISNWSIRVMADLRYYPTADPEDFMRSYLRYQLAPVMCEIDRDDCRQAAVDQFNNLKNNLQEVPADSRNWVYCNALREGTGEDFTFLRDRFLEHNVYTEKILLLSVLGCTSDPTSLHQFLNDIIMPNEIVRPQDYTTAFNSAVTGNEENTQVAFAWIQDNLAAVINAFNGATTPLSYISSRLRTEAEIVAFQQWATQNADALGNDYTSVFNGAESARQSIQWTATVTADISSYLENGFQEVVLTTPAPVVQPESPVLEERPELEQPITPDLFDSACATFLSMTVLGFAALFNFLL